MKIYISNLSSLPAAPHADASRKEEAQSTIEPYREGQDVVLSLAIMSRSDIAKAICSVLRRMHDTTREDLGTMMNILGYLRGTKDPGLKHFDSKWGGGGLVAYANSNYAADCEDRKSVSGGGLCMKPVGLDGSQESKNSFRYICGGDCFSLA